MIINKINIGDKVKITKKGSLFKNMQGEIFKQGNGNMWEIQINNIGIYFSENQFKKI